MNSIDKHYVANCEKEGKMFIMNGDRLESMTLVQYNERHGTSYESWDSINDDNLYTGEEVIDMYGQEEVKFV